MKLTRYVVPFLLLAGVASAQAQPIVKINSGSSATECDVTNPTDGAIFRLDTSGNVLITGILSGQGCGGGSQGGGVGSITFNPLSPAPFPLTTGANSISVGTNTSVSYSAANAKSCNVTSSTGTPSPSGSGSCPAVTLANTSCTGTTNCSANGTATAPAALSGPTSCAYTLTAKCSNDTQTDIASTANLTVTTTVVEPPPGSCPDLHTISTGSGGTWVQLTGNTQVKFGDNATKQANAADYIDMWSHTGTTVPWAGTSGLTTRSTASPNQYFAEKFTVPSNLVADGSLNARWLPSGSGMFSNFSMTISTCPGDFGQSGTKITASGCKLNQPNSSNGLKAFVSTPSGSACTVQPGQTYYLNILPSADLPQSNVSTTSCTVAGACVPWIGVFTNIPN